MTENKLAIQDQTAATQLCDIILKTTSEMAELGQHVSLMGYPHKFNDAGYDDYWFGVHIDGAFMEVSQFFRYAVQGHPYHEEGYDMGRGRLERRLGYTPSIKDGYEPLPAMKKKLQKGQRLLENLEKTNWRELSKKALPNGYNGLGISLYPNGDVYLLTVLYSGSDDGELWKCTKDRTIHHLKGAVSGTIGFRGIFI